MFLKLIYLLWFRLEEKLSNSELENQALRQQALALSPTGKALSVRPKSMIIQVSLLLSLFTIISLHYNIQIH
jgi:hypothetical protein